MCCQSDSTTFIKDYLPLIVSILALALSVIAIIIERKGRRVELENEYFAEHFKDYLYKTIPNTRNKISFSNECLTDVQPLLDTLSQMRRKADYFRFANPKFYKRFKQHNQNIEDFLANGMNIRNYDAERQKAFLCECDEKLTELYRIITKQNFGA